MAEVIVDFSLFAVAALPHLIESPGASAFLLNDLLLTAVAGYSLDFAEGLCRSVGFIDATLFGELTLSIAAENDFCELMAHLGLFGNASEAITIDSC